MRVRQAIPGDRAACIDLLRESHGAAGFPWPFLAARADALFELHCTSPAACCWVFDRDGRASGLLMATIFEHPLWGGLWANETVWYVTPSARGRRAIRMLDAYEGWARDKGCSVVGMASLASNDVSGIYRHCGYAPAETHHIKHL